MAGSGVVSFTVTDDDGATNRQEYEDGTNPQAMMQLPPSLNQDVDGNYIVPIENFVEGRWVIALTATDVQGDESGLSNTLGFSIAVAPKAPLLLAS